MKNSFTSFLKANAFTLILTSLFIGLSWACPAAMALHAPQWMSSLGFENASVPFFVFGMATTNSFGTLAQTGLIHDALNITVKKLPFLKRMASDIAATGASQGLPFNVALILKDWNASQTVYDRVTTGTYEKQVGQTLPADKTLTLDQWPYVAISLSAVEVNQLVMGANDAALRARAIEKLMKKGFNALGLSIVNAFLAKITAANFPTVTYVSAVGTMDYKQLGAAVDQLLLADTLMDKPDAILNVAAYREFVNSLTAVANSSYDIEEPVRDATISEPVSGANSVSRYNVTMPADALRGIVFDPQAIVMANRVPIEETLEGNDPVYLEVVTDPDTGFSILYREFKNAPTGEVTRNITTLYGFGLGLVNHLVRVTPS